MFRRAASALVVLFARLAHASHITVQVEELPQCRAMVGQVTVNGKAKSVVFDTGSNSFWVDSANGVCPNTKGNFKIEYGSGDVFGTFCSSTVHAALGQNQQQCTVNIDNMPISSTKPDQLGCGDEVDGILGLALPQKYAAAGIPFMRSYNKQTTCSHGTLDMSWSFRPCSAQSTSRACASMTLGHMQAEFTGKLYTETLYSHTDCNVNKWTVPLVGASVGGMRLPGITPDSRHVILFDTGTSVTTFPTSLLSDSAANTELTLQFSTVTLTLPNVQVDADNIGAIVLGVDSLKHLYLEFDALGNYIRIAKPETLFDENNPPKFEEPLVYYSFGSPSACKVNQVLYYAVLSSVGVLAAGVFFIMIT